MEKYFSTNASFQVVEKDFLAIEYHKIFYRLVETYFFFFFSFQLLEKNFLFNGNRLLYLTVLSY